ncbi:hypothetical protein GCM10027020_03190 [Nocardioides salsibiostraticola]
MIQRLALPFAIAVLLAGGVFALWPAPGSHETDRVARVVAEAISYPPQESSVDYARAAAESDAGEDGRLMVIEMNEFDAEDAIDPTSELVFLVRHSSSSGGFSNTEPDTACYRVMFNHYGVIGKPWRADCPAEVVPVQLP